MSWVALGTLQTGVSLPFSMAYYANEIYVAYKTTSNEIIVKKFDGADWVQIGGTILFVYAPVPNGSMRIDPSNGYIYLLVSNHDYNDTDGAMCVWDGLVWTTTPIWSTLPLEGSQARLCKEVVGSSFNVVGGNTLATETANFDLFEIRLYPWTGTAWGTPTAAIPSLYTKGGAWNLFMHGVYNGVDYVAFPGLAAVGAHVENWYVFKYESGAWSQVGATIPAPFDVDNWRGCDSDSSDNNRNLHIVSETEIYLSWHYSNGTIYIYKFNGTSWSILIDSSTLGFNAYELYTDFLGDDIIITAADPYTYATHTAKVNKDTLAIETDSITPMVIDMMVDQSSNTAFLFTNPTLGSTSWQVYSNDFIPSSSSSSSSNSSSSSSSSFSSCSSSSCSSSSCSSSFSSSCSSSSCSSSSSSSCSSSCSSSFSSSSSSSRSSLPTPTQNFNLKVNRALNQGSNYSVDLEWTHVRGVLGYNVYRAETPSDDPGDWYKINSKVIHVNYFQDRGFAGGYPTNHERNGQFFYKVIPILQDGSEYPLSQSKSETYTRNLSGIQKYVAPTIRMRTQIMLDPTRFSAAEVVHFLCRMWAGEYCSCIDVRTRKVDSNCPKCNGTGFAGGYELIENVYCRIKSNPQKLQGNSGGIFIQELTSGTIATYPILSDNDVIIRSHNVRYFVRDVKARAIQGYVTAQAFNLEKVQLYDMVYRIPAPPIVEPTRQVSLMDNVL